MCVVLYSETDTDTDKKVSKRIVWSVTETDTNTDSHSVLFGICINCIGLCLCVGLYQWEHIIIEQRHFFQSDDPVIQFRRNKSDACVPVGGYEIMWVDIYIPPGSLATYEVEAFGPGNLSQTQENTMFLCDS